MNDLDDAKARAEAKFATLEKRRAAGDTAMADYRRDAQEVEANRQRLKALREARDASSAEPKSKPSY